MSRAIEVGASVEYVRYMAGWATKITGQTLDVSIPFPPGARYTAYTRKEPVGVVAAIVPWNFPLMIAVWKLIPALAAGCTIVLKPSPETPLTALRWPHARPACRPACSTSSPAAACAALASHPSIAKISFTADRDRQAGRRGGRAEHDALLARAGGKNPIVMLGDVDVAQALDGAPARSSTRAGARPHRASMCTAASSGSSRTASRASRSR